MLSSRPEPSSTAFIKQAWNHPVGPAEGPPFDSRFPFEKPSKLFGASGDGLLQLYAHILKAQQNFAIYPMDLDVYL
jgi:hypothetical protein